MHITKIELENIKSHADSTFEFERGTTAITGENGAGKTTLIEAVAWALFDLLDYKKEDFVSRGAKKGVVRVTFESGLDEREYTVYRDTATGYYVYDPRLKMRIADKKDEVCRFLWQHLGVEAGTDLDSLFRRAIGVPQGTFTAIFLETVGERKKAFDKLLKVEEYRRGADELLKTSRHIEHLTAAVRERIARAEGEIAMIDAYESEHRSVSSELEKLTADFASLETALTEKRTAVTDLDKGEIGVRRTKTEFDKISADISRARIIASQCEANLQQGRDAAAIVQRVRPDAERHTQALSRLAELERERAEREKLNIQSAKLGSAIAVVLADQKHTASELVNALAAHAKIAELKDDCEAEKRLAKEIDALRNDLAGVRSSERQMKSLDEKIERLRESYRVNQIQLNEAAGKIAAAGPLDSLQARDVEIVRQLAHLQASLERDERFQKEIQNGLCPILSQKCLNLKEGETLDAFISSQFGELRTQISTLETEHVGVAAILKTSREAEKYLASHVTLKEREEEITTEGKRLREERDTLDVELGRLSKLESELARVESELRLLNNPSARVELLKKDAAREGELRAAITNVESNLERLRSDLRILEEHLESYKDLDGQFAEMSSLRSATSDAYRLFISNESLASTVAEREKACIDATSAVGELSEAEFSANAAHEKALSDYDAAAHVLARNELLDLQTKHAEMRAVLASARGRADALANELKRLGAIRSSMFAEFKEKERLEKVAEATTFIRDTLKDAAPLVARNYVHHVSLEANQMFREITGNAERSLRWAEDYGIQLEEDGYDRPFANLSGGEQMAAALSVRLALLKQLTDIRIAFFDEPTTNMDAERRENLAMEIGKIKHFDQLFVISHDDTFEGYLDHELRVGGDQA
ncbi:MAG: AAA family ATPase [Pyrinomonadaceae bacterium]